MTLLFALGLSFILCYISMPSIIRIAFKWGVLDKPAFRKSHKVVTPSIGGVGIFLASILVSLLLIPTEAMEQVRFILAAMTIMFLVGARDDLDPLSPWAKLVGQLIAISLLIFFADIRLEQLYGLFGIYDLTYGTSVVLTTLLFVYLINSFNLIDGIDGLCSSISILALIVMGTWFFLNGLAAYAIIAFTTAGATIAFLKYNISPSKVFMGDTGSLVLGTICTTLILELLRVNSYASVFTFDSAVIFGIGLFILPAFDTLRVFTIRLLKGRSPLLPDDNHLHHLLLKIGLTHMQATSLLVSVNAMFLFLAMQCQHFSPTAFLLTALSLAIAMTMMLHLTLYMQEQSSLRTDP